MQYPNDRELSRLADMAQRYADDTGKAHCVINLNRVGARMLVVREHVAAWDSDPDLVRHTARPKQG